MAAADSEKYDGGRIEQNSSQQHASQEPSDSSELGPGTNGIKDSESRDNIEALLDTARNASTIEDYGVRIDSSKMHQYQGLIEEPMTQGRREVVVKPKEAPTQISPINIAILIVGTRGDVQPFLAIGRKLKEHGHRVRVASHGEYRSFVMEAGLEFYPLGGDPKILAHYMVKNKGILPSSPGEVSDQRAQLREIVQSTWLACTEADKESGGSPFRADAIIANPPTTGHTHVAEALDIPLHIFFTMPWTATRDFPHPFAMVGYMGTWASWENLLSYMVVENFVDIGIRDIVNEFRCSLGLAPISYLHVSSYTHQTVATAYLYSPSLAPKPKDWGPLIDVVGFCFLDLGSSYTPAPELMAFLEAGPPPIYVGFGSLPVQDPKKMTGTIVKALKETGQRGIIQRGWGGLGEVSEETQHVLTIGNCPHDWLFERCKAVVHHGGAGTTAAGLKASCPTTVVPFFGDQFFWGRCCQEQGVGPEPIPASHFDFDRLVAAINFMLKPEVKQAAEEMAKKIQSEDGVEGAVAAFHKHLPSVIREIPVEVVQAAKRRTWKEWWGDMLGHLNFCVCLCQSRGIAGMVGEEVDVTV